MKEMKTLTFPDGQQFETVDAKARNDIAGLEENKASKDELKVVELIAKGRSTGYVFNTEADMNTWLSDSENSSQLHLGDNLYIRELDVPDYWWDGTTAQPLETQKVDLSEYYTKEQVDLLFGVAMVDNSKFTTALGNNETFASILASNNDFASNLGLNSELGRTLGGNNSYFVEALASNNAFGDTLASWSIYSHLSSNTAFTDALRIAFRDPKHPLGIELASNSAFQNSFYNTESVNKLGNTLASNSYLYKYLAVNNDFGSTFASNSGFLMSFEYGMFAYLNKMIIPRPSSGDVGKVLVATSEGSVSWSAV